jgi:hypothetical protein
MKLENDDNRGKKTNQIHVTSLSDYHPIDDDDSNNYRLTKSVEVEEDDEDDEVHKTIIHLNLPSELIGEEIDVYRGYWMNDQVYTLWSRYQK